jgi:ABC-type sugar transport system permease subunit
LSRFYYKNATWITGYLFVAPALALYIIFRVYPIVFGSFISFFRWNGLTSMKFIGLENFKEIFFQDKIFRVALLHNTIYAIGTVSVKNVLGLLLALLINECVRGKTFYRTTLFMPVVTSFVAIGILWSWILNPAFGLLNSILTSMHLGFLVQEWVTNPDIALYSLIGIDVWKWIGFHMVIYLAALGRVPKSLYEAATLDGATKTQFFLHVTIYLLMPIIAFNVLISLIGGFSVFDLVFVVTQGGPFYATEVVLTHTYTQAFQFHRIGYGTATAYVLFVIVLILSLIQMKAMGGEKYEF